MDSAFIFFALVTFSIPVLRATFVTVIDVIVVTVLAVETITPWDHVIEVLDVVAVVTRTPLILTPSLIIDFVSTVGTPVLSFYLLELNEVRVIVC
jgi:hypothetical protein